MTSKADLSTLRYFQVGYERDPTAFWLADTNRKRPPLRVVKLANRGLLERCDTPGSFDLFRLSEAGRSALAR